MIRRRAFTILELLLATILLSALMISILSVLTHVAGPLIASSARANQPQDHHQAGTVSIQAISDAATIDAWTRLLRDDLEQALTIDADSANQLTIIGYHALDQISRQRVHRPVRTTYQIETIDGRGWVIRSQAWLDVLSNQNVRRDLICTGVAGFQISAASDASHGGGTANASNQSNQEQHDRRDDQMSTAPVVAAQPDDTIYLNGLPVYRSTAPAWVIEEARKEAALKASQEGTIQSRRGEPMASLPPLANDARRSDPATSKSSSAGRDNSSSCRFLSQPAYSRAVENTHEYTLHPDPHRPRLAHRHVARWPSHSDCAHRS